MVDQATSNMSFQPEDKVFINYWFRHMWEYCLPLYPGLLLAAHISGVPLGTLILWQWPFAVIWALLGYWYIFRPFGGNKEAAAATEAGTEAQPKQEEGHSLMDLIKTTWPLWCTVLLVLAHVSIVISIIGVLLLLIIQKRYPLQPLIKTIFEPLTARIVFLTWGTLAFKDVLEAPGRLTN
nr:DUF401 family protein [Desulforamulus aquiferis]